MVALTQEQSWAQYGWFCHGRSQFIWYSNYQHSAAKNGQFIISLTDLLFIFMLSFTHIAALGKGIATTEMPSYFHKTMTAMVILSMFVPLLYISYLIGSWLISKVTIHVPCLSSSNLSWIHPIICMYAALAKSDIIQYLVYRIFVTTRCMCYR